MDQARGLESLQNDLRIMSKNLFSTFCIDTKFGNSVSQYLRASVMKCHARLPPRRALDNTFGEETQIIVSFYCKEHCHTWPNTYWLLSYDFRMSK